MSSLTDSLNEKEMASFLRWCEYELELTLKVLPTTLCRRTTTLCRRIEREDEESQDQARHTWTADVREGFPVSLLKFAFPS